MQAAGRSVVASPAGTARLVTARTVTIFRYACPYCAAELTEQDEALFCTREGRPFSQEAGIWQLLRRERAAALQPFVEAYTHARDAGGWSAPSHEYCLPLPFRDSTRRHREVWRVYAAGFRALERVLDREFRDRPVRALDLGAGNCWLTRRLAAKGYAACALDLRTDAVDGLSAGEVYRTALGSRFERVQAELECLPFVSRQFELVVAHGSLHYSEHLDVALDEARRVLAPDGIFVMMGTPFYHDGPHATHTLTYGELPRRLGRHGLEADLRHPFAGVRAWTRPWLARLRRHPEPPSFPLVICRPTT